MPGQTSIRFDNEDEAAIDTLVAMFKLRAHKGDLPHKEINRSTVIRYLIRTMYVSARESGELSKENIAEAQDLTASEYLTY